MDNPKPTEGPYYTLRGFDADGKMFIAMSVFAASAGLESVKANALGMLKDGGYECATADAVELKRTNQSIPKEVACPDCYGGHFRPCQMCGDTGRVTFIPKED